MYDIIVLMCSATQIYVPPYGIQGALEYFKQSYGNPPLYIHENGKLL
jgi:beta-glucosidase